MKITTQKLFGICLFLLMVLSVVPADATETFHITYRQENISNNTADNTLSGVFFLTVVNVSGQEVQDLVAWVPEQNNVTYDNRRIFVGNMANGQQVEVLNQFTVPAEFADPNAVEQNVEMKVEYTSPTGVRTEVDVVGTHIIF